MPGAAEAGTAQPNGPMGAEGGARTSAGWGEAAGGVARRERGVRRLGHAEQDFLSQATVLKAFTEKGLAKFCPLPCYKAETHWTREGEAGQGGNAHFPSSMTEGSREAGTPHAWPRLSPRRPWSGERSAERLRGAEGKTSFCPTRRPQCGTEGSTPRRSPPAEREGQPHEVRKQEGVARLTGPQGSCVVDSGP